MAYELHYWPTIQGRGEFVRLALEAAGALRYAFPQATVRALAKTPAIVDLHSRVGALPRIAAYLQSDRRLAFNEQGIFRRYPELDAG